MIYTYIQGQKFCYNILGRKKHKIQIGNKEKRVKKNSHDISLMTAHTQTTVNIMSLNVLIQQNVYLFSCLIKKKKQTIDYKS